MAPKKPRPQFAAVGAAPPPAASRTAAAQPSQMPAGWRPSPAPHASRPAQPLRQTGSSCRAHTAVQPAYNPAQPDLSVKYHVLLGLPQDRPGDGFDAPAIEKADVATGLDLGVSTPPQDMLDAARKSAPSDKVAIKLRVLMTPEGRLAAEPVLIEASASIKGPLLMQSAIAALQSVSALCDAAGR